MVYPKPLFLELPQNINLVQKYFALRISFFFSMNEWLHLQFIVGVYAQGEKPSFLKSYI